MKNIKYIGLVLIIILAHSCSSNESRDINDDIKTVTDTDGYTYEVVKICDKIWMKRNLEVMHYRNGDLIPQVTNPAAWSKLTTGAWCYYQNNTSNGPIYGKLYNWYAVNDPRGIAPKGWHIPTENEVVNMINCLGGIEVAGGKMKSTLNYWANPNLGANNYSGFSALPGGSIESTMPGSSTPSASFTTAGYYAEWWTTTKTYNQAVGYTTTYKLTSCYTFSTSPSSGYSVRCIKD